MNQLKQSKTTQTYVETIEPERHHSTFKQSIQSIVSRRFIVKADSYQLLLASCIGCYI